MSAADYRQWFRLTGRASLPLGGDIRSIGWEDLAKALDTRLRALRIALPAALKKKPALLDELLALLHDHQ